MNKTRVEAFSDGVFAILITILVLELKIPHSAELAALRPILPSFLAYFLSFLILGIFWSNHHHLLHTTDRVNGKILLANLHLLFWLSLAPFTTGWMGGSYFAALPTAVYGIVFFMAAVAWRILQSAIIQLQGPDSLLAAAVQKDFKGKISVVLYAAAIPLAFYHGWISCVLYFTVAFIWLIPDRRIESIISQDR